MRYFTKQQGQKEAVPVDLEPLGNDQFKITVGATTYQVDALALEHGTLSMLVDGQSYNVEFEENGDELGVLLRG
ncbi:MULTISPECIES: hypothetical protein [Myxococcus]|nr:hypothetical protein [Myxococcus sp. CA005]